MPSPPYAVSEAKFNSSKSAGYSIKQNGLDPYRYLIWLMHDAPMRDMDEHDQVAMLMPVNAPVECRVDNVCQDRLRVVTKAILI